MTELSLTELFWGASVPVKGVMLLLLAASLTSWALIVQRGLVFRKAKKELEEFEELFWSGMELGRLYHKTSAQKQELTGLASIFVAGFKEFVKLHKQTQIQAAAVMEGAQRTMRLAFNRESDRLEHHLPFLATVASVSPYVGLFGTVWGIMNSFRALGAVQQASLSMVAPGISEALIATAIGLFAAIPAVIAYNRYSQWLGTCQSRYGAFLEEFTSILHRQAYAEVTVVEGGAKCIQEE